jgi:hypothetical protein
MPPAMTAASGLAASSANVCDPVPYRSHEQSKPVSAVRFIVRDMRAQGQPLANADRARRPATALRGHRCACTALRVGRRPPLRGQELERGSLALFQGSRLGYQHTPTGLQAPRGGSLARSPHPLLP